MTGPDAPLSPDPLDVRSTPDWLAGYDAGWEDAPRQAAEPRGYVTVGVFFAVLGAAIASAVLILLLHYAPVEAAPRGAPAAIPAAAHPEIPSQVSVRVTSTAASGNLPGLRGAPQREETTRGGAPSPTADPGSSSGSSSIQAAHGPATWYCCTRRHPSGLYAAAGPALRVGDWRGRRVEVCGNGSCVRVTLIDWCACGSGRVIDLYPGAFRRLAPLSQGVVVVTVSWGGSPRPPATDTAP